MKTRILFAAVALPLLLVLVLACPVWATAVFLAAASVAAVYELLYSTGIFRNLRVIVWTSAAAAGVCLWCGFGMPHIWGLVIVWLFLAALFAEFLLAKTQMGFSRLCTALFAGLVVPFCLSALTRILAMHLGRYYIIAALILPFASDSGAYFAGLRFGKHKLAPVISPNKTVEGLVGGVIGATIGILLYCLILQLVFSRSVDYLSGIIYGVFGALAGTAGDLVFSTIKRQTGIKDYGSILPGHGGVLDRLDSMVATAPSAELMVLLLPLIVK